MFYRGYPVISALARPEAVAPPKAPGALAERAESEAMRAMSRDFRTMRLSERLNDPAGYLKLQQAKRRSLEALLVVPPEKNVLSRVTDLICMISEESDWSENTGLSPFADEGHPVIDFQCAETAALFGWTCRAMGPQLDEISPRITSRMLAEARRRVFAPFLAHGDYPFMKGRGQRPMAILCDIVLSAILLETDVQRRNAVLKLGLRLTDQLAAAMDGRKVRLPGRIALADLACDVAAITDLALLVRRITRGEVDLTPEFPTPEWLDVLLYAWMGGEYFADPAGGVLKPDLSGAELFRIGLAANDEAMATLGAHLNRLNPRPSSTLTGRILDMNGHTLLAAENRKPPRIKHAATPGNGLMCARFDGLTFVMHTGGARSNAGDILLLGEKSGAFKPVFIGLPGFSSLPTVAGQAQLSRPDSPCVGDFQIKNGREQMTVDLSHAYPTGAVIQSYQRTALLLREEGVLRIVDAFELSEPGSIAFSFITPETPFRSDGYLQIGPVDFMWEGELSYSLEVLPSSAEFPLGLNRITLTTPEPVSRAFFTFNIAARLEGRA